MQFGITGYKNFTKWSKPLPPLQGTLTGKNIVITGANSGIGLEAAKFAASKEGKVFLVCRNEKRGSEAVDLIQKETGNQNVHLILGEMGDKKSMQGVFEQLKEKVGSIDVFVHNAGCMIHKREFTEDKIEKNFAVNTYAVYYLSKKSLELFHQDSRVITVASGGMLTEKLKTEDLYMEKGDFDGTKQYARNKRQQVALMEYFGEKYP